MFCLQREKLGDNEQEGRWGMAVHSINPIAREAEVDAGRSLGSKPA